MLGQDGRCPTALVVKSIYKQFHKKGFSTQLGRNPKTQSKYPKLRFGPAPSTR